MTNLARIFRNDMNPWDLMFKNLLDNDAFFAPISTTSIKYPVDIYETDEGLNFEVAVVGIDKKDINIEEEEGILRISYEKNDSYPEDEQFKDRFYVQKSIAKRSFNFGWRISDKFNLKKIDAQLDKGILKITVPKADEKQTVKNTIKIK